MKGLAQIIGKRWSSLSIAKKLYVVVGIMAFLIAGELLILEFSMTTLSAVRAFVGGEGLWSKAQKDSAISLLRYELTRDEQDFQAFLDALKIPEGDHLARISLEKPVPDRESARQGFLAGNIHPDDIDPMIDLILRFSNVSYLKRAIAAWTEADLVLSEFKAAANEYRRLLHEPNPDREKIRSVRATLSTLNERLTELETQFSDELGAGSRWMEGVIISLLFLAVLAVECIGLTLTFLTSRSISRRLENISDTAKAIGEGDFTRRAVADSNDEIGRVALAVNQMGGLLEHSYADLNRRVEERTRELANAVKSRDEFLSIASHELKTPLTALQLQLQALRLLISANGEGPAVSPQKLQGLIDTSEKRIRKLSELIDMLLDISRIEGGKLKLELTEVNLTDAVKDVLALFSEQIAQAKCVLSCEIDENVRGHWDRFRLEQVITNLLSNALKYGASKPIEIKLTRESGDAVLRVRDHGIGVRPEDKLRIFNRFERCASSQNFSGLGLGLYISKQILDLHGGQIDVDSGSGHGSTFTVKLPLREPGDEKGASA